MNIVCIDDEKLILDNTVIMCKDMKETDEVSGFTNPYKALDYIRENTVDIALVDINMPEIDGINLAKLIKKEKPDIAIVFLTGYSEYAVDAFSIHAQGYILKPVSKDKLFEELRFAYSHKPYKTEDGNSCSVKVNTFGNFDVFVDGRQVDFRRSRAKELFAYLIDRRGSSITRAEAFTALWEEGAYDRSMQKQLDVIIRSLKDTLEEYGISDILNIQKGSMRIVPELVDCDMYRFLDGDVNAINAYRGEYMSAYAWADFYSYLRAEMSEKYDFI